MRYAIYFTPPQDSPLTRLAASWLGRDPFNGASVPPPLVTGLTPGEIAFHTAAARRYGFHATLKAPFLLAANETEAGLAEAVSEFAANVAPFVIPRLAVGQIDRFFALLPASPVAELDALAGNAVKAFDRFRSPMTEAEIERRNPDALSAEEFRNLCQWGYPYVFDTFRFHMTLTGRVASGESPARARGTRRGVRRRAGRAGSSRRRRAVRRAGSRRALHHPFMARLRAASPQKSA